MTPRAALERGLEELELALPASTCDQLIAYVMLLAKWNRSYNLTAVRDPLAMVSQHLLDSLAVLPHLPLQAARVADVGTGAGLPGIPLALARPQWHVALIESNQKKAAFLRQAMIELSIANVEVHAGRAEEWQPQERFGLVTSRAFAELAAFVAACRHLLAPGGTFAAMKGKQPQAEIERLPPDVRLRSVLRLRTPLREAERHLVLCELQA
ncbi:MAG TPA: 16S rRNA (guanine(527)-N(7))-methyltransferase RsmG [Burkholderiales bacterium]|jgi:16S rRNA (guanine527-N7)-methyltransferase